MPKKTRKMKQRAAMRRSAVVTPAQGTVESTGASVRDVATSARPMLSSARPVTPLTFNYEHIYGDLKRIALFAGFFFALLIVLSFVIK